MKRPRTWKGTVAAVTVASATAVAGSAGATSPVAIYNGLFYGGAAGSRAPASSDHGMVNIETPHVSRSKYGWFATVCDYNARERFMLPSGYTYETAKGGHQGCSYFAWFDFPEDTAAYPAHTLYAADWKDSDTNSQFKKIGSQELITGGV